MHYREPVPPEISAICDGGNIVLFHYAILIASCQLIMCFCGLLFAICAMAITDTREKYKCKLEE